jgi:hypothetical protein
MTDGNISNQKTVTEFADYIRTCYQSINKNWLQIAEAFAEAKEMFGSGSSSFKQLAKTTRFSESSISKLISVVNSKRLKEYAVQFSSVQSWPTLYAISTLNEDQFELFKKHFSIDENPDTAPFITQSDVNRFRKEQTEKSLFRGYAVVQVDDEAVKGGLLSGDEYSTLQQLLEKMETLSSYVAIKRLGNDEKEELSRLNRLENKVRQIARRLLMETINARLAKYKKHKGEKQGFYEARVLGRNREELMNDFQVDEAEVFAFLGIEYDLGKFYKEAEAEMLNAEVKLTDRYAKKVLSRPPVVKEVEIVDDDFIEPPTYHKAGMFFSKPINKDAFKDFR